MRELKRKHCIKGVPQEMGYRYIEYIIREGYWNICEVREVVDTLLVADHILPLTNTLCSWNITEKGPAEYKDLPIRCTDFQYLHYPEFE